MARGNTWTNADGLVIGFERRDSINPYDSEVHTLGRVKQHEVVVDFSNVADFVGAALPPEGSKHFVIPAGSSIVGCTITVTDGVVGPASIAIGIKDTVTGALSGADDTLVTDAEGIAANLATGDKLVGTGTLTAAQSVVTAVDATLAITETTGNMTAGQFIVLVEYIEPQASQDSPAIIVGEI